MSGLLLAFVPSPAVVPKVTPPKPASLVIKPGPATVARPIHPRMQPRLPVSPLPAVPGGGAGGLPPASNIPAAAGAAAGGLSLPALGFAFALAIPQVLFFDQPLSPDQGNVPQPGEPSQTLEPPVFPFTGGQDPNRDYEILFAVTNLSYFTPSGTEISGGAIRGKVTSVIIVQVFVGDDSNGRPRYTHTVEARNNLGQLATRRLDPGNGEAKDAYRLKGLIPLGAGADNFGNPPATSPGIDSPPGNFIAPGVPAPPNFAPVPVPGAPPLIAPSPAPNNPNPDQEEEPKKSPVPIPVPRPRPGDTPQPNRDPDPTPSAPDFFPTFDPSPTPGVGVGSPNPAPTPAPGVPQIQNPTIVNPRIYTPNLPLVGNPLTPNPLPTPAPFTANPLQPNPLSPSPFTPNPNTGNPEPLPIPVTPAPNTPAPTQTPIDDIRENINRYLGPIAVMAAGITALVQPERLREAANAGSCQSFAPGGCNAPIANNAAAAAANSANNNTLLAQILAVLQALQTFFMVPILAGVNLINTKLGPVMSGLNGIGGFLARTAEAAKLDKVLNAMNTILLLHNAAMLSRNLGSTLGDLTSQALTTIGIKDSEGAGIDVNEILGKQANSFMASLLGAEVWAGTKASWNKASSIIASATNLMYTMRSIFDSTREILEWTAENTGKIGNALKRFRIVGENAFNWLPERVTVQNSFTRKLDRFREGVDDLDDAASSFSGVLGEVQSIQQEYADLQEQKQKFETNIKDLTPKPRVENKPVADAAVVAKTASAAPSGIENVFRGEGEQIDA
ncbi:hypothetical protein [Synechocystis sp. PCC 7509]|uniref:hypothetical protein n=1 Tax=Synechocystis sp. PCC 7509 TaxID=927677 RepID=UPI0002ABA5EA|nr:hypothetical protein [Synechocystis sp. PCC 7509]